MLFYSTAFGCDHTMQSLLETPPVEATPAVTSERVGPQAGKTQQGRVQVRHTEAGRKSAR